MRSLTSCSSPGPKVRKERSRSRASTPVEVELGSPEKFVEPIRRKLEESS